MSNKLDAKKLITFKDQQDIFSEMSDKQRIKYTSKAYAKMSIAKAFGIWYGVEISNEVKTNRAVNTVEEIVIGNVYYGNVMSFRGNSMTFTIPGVKEEIICNENFNSCYDLIECFLVTNNNRILFEVREKRNGKYYVSVIGAYYKLWISHINNAIRKETPIKVHIDELVKGGYVCHVDITTLNELTGKNYTHSVFIPGSQIVLNIESDFERWIGQDIDVIPQKFVEFKKSIIDGKMMIENSLVCSRKRLLQLTGQQYMSELYNVWKLSQSNNSKGEFDRVFDGQVTGIINSNKKTGVFIELDGMYITGLMPVTSTQLLDYRPGNPIKVKVADFETLDGKDPFIYNKNNVVVKCNARPIFKLA